MNNSQKPIHFQDHQSKKAANAIAASYATAAAKTNALQTDAPKKFLAAWIRGIKKVGPEFFKIKGNLSEANDKWQLEPNLDFIRQAIGGLSHGQQVLLGLLYSFFDSIEGQKLLAQADAPNLVDALAILDLDGRKIIAELWMYYTGW